MTTWWPGDQVAAAAGRLCGASRRLHRVLGRASLTSSDPARTVAFDEWSLAHAWHADELFDRLPLRDGVLRDALVTLGDDEPLFARLDALAVDDDVALLGGYCVVIVPWLLRETSDLAKHTSDAADRSLRRTLSFVQLDLAAIEQRSRGLLGETSELSEHVSDTIGELAARGSITLSDAASDPT